MNDVTKDLLKALKIVTSQLERVGDTRKHKDGEFIDLGREAIARAEASPESGRPTMAVWFGEMPESNGKMNWTAILYRREVGVMDGVTIYRSEYKDRVRYEADRLRWLIGELKHKPNILAYDADLTAEASLFEPQPDADGWIPWAGGECPVPRYAIVEIMFRGGHKTRTYAGSVSWTRCGLEADIVAYRIVTEALNDWT